MSVKSYGIYLSYPPGVDLRHEGLGRYLAAFLKGTAGRDDVRFILVCPSWSRKGLQELFASEGVEASRFEIKSPPREPMMLRIYEGYAAYKKRTRKVGLVKRTLGSAVGWAHRIASHVEHRFVTLDTAWDLLPLVLLGLLALVLAVVLSPTLLVVLAAILLVKCKRFVVSKLAPYFNMLSRLSTAVSRPKDDAFILRLYQGMEHVESERMLDIVKKLDFVRAWYSPTAFWPAFNKIDAPRLMCVPDVVLTDFPVGFSEVGGGRFMKVFGAVENAIYTGQHFVTYSAAVKWDTLVDRYAVHADNVSVVHHAPNNLDKLINVDCSEGGEAISVNYARTLFKSALKKAYNKSYTATFANDAVKFLFYASQFRPNKNVLSLLRAYEYLLRKRYVGHKLIMTGHPDIMPAIRDFIHAHHLENDVLCLHGLSLKELAACYKLADLAVNPTLSEGGCPFTFTEALSVGTPVVMSRIPVAEEVLNDRELQRITFFDPYDWRDMANKIEGAINSRSSVLAVQKKFYDKLNTRSWVDVVNEHIEVLERISLQQHEHEKA